MKRLGLSAACAVAFFCFNATDGYARAYPTCESNIAVDGRIFALIRSASHIEGNCWKYVKNGSTISASELSPKLGSYQFMLVVNQEISHDERLPYSPPPGRGP